MRCGRSGPPLPGMPSAVEPQGAVMAALCPTRYVDDTQAITLAPMAEAQAVTDRMAVWMADTGQSGNATKSTSWLLREPPGGVASLTLGGVAIPLSQESKQLGVGQRLAAEKGMGPVLRGRLDKGLAITRRVGCLPPFLMREAAVGALANSVALYGVELADVEGHTLPAADTAAAKAVWGPTRCSWAGQGSPPGPLGHGLLCIAFVARAVPAPAPARPPARTPGTTRTLVQAVLECRDPLPSTGPMGRALQAARQLGWQRREGWWHWDVLGQPTPLYLVQADEGDLRHHVRESQRYQAFWDLERRRPGTFGGLGGAVHRQACSDGLRLASTEGERSIPRGLLAGPTWTAGRAAGHAIV